MTNEPSLAGQQLLALLPEVYRSRDRQVADLAGYLGACGELLDLIRGTLDQRLADCFPDAPPEGLAAQPWLLPYFAELLDARLLSPHLEGRRAEVGRAVAWRQRKGTLPVAAQIAEAVAQLDVEVQEGWQRLATTPRVGLPLLPATAFGVAPEVDESNPLQAAQHPGLPAVTVDVRHPSRAIATSSDHPAHPFGAPCFPGSYEDASRRTVDLRTPNFKAGHYHPRRLLLFAPPPTGFFPLPVVTFPPASEASPRQVRMTWGERGAADGDKYVQEVALTEDGDVVHHIFNPSRMAGAEGGPVAVTITTSPLPFDAPLDVLRIEDVNFLGTLTVNSGRVELRRVAARKLTILPSAGELPVIDAVDCLFDTIEVKDPPAMPPPAVETSGLVRLEHCTVLTALRCQRLQASDCLFTSSIELTSAVSPASCARYSRLPPNLSLEVAARLEQVATTSAQPVFHEFAYCDGDVHQTPAPFGDPGCAVLHPATPESICFGAEDGAEMGAHHHLGYCAQSAALLAKIDEFLPLGIEAVLVHDPRLLTLPASELLTPQFPTTPTADD